MSKLYLAPDAHPTMDINTFLAESSLLALVDTQRDTLGAPIMETEVRQAIKELKAHKCPDSDGFTALFYKKLTDMFNSLRDGANLTPTTLKTNIVMFPKLDQDTRFWATFCTISLLNVDLKLLTKILASRVIHTLIHKDQVGLFP